MFEVPYRLTGQTGSIALALTSSLYSLLVLSSSLYVHISQDQTPNMSST